jgi:type II secretory pathway predicted ATPase ExeA
MNAAREAVRRKLRVYMSRTGLGLHEIAEATGYSWQTLRQFASGARFGWEDAAGDETARHLDGWLEANPAALPEIPGKLYETEATRAMDELLDYAREGGWGTLYGPAGAQKTFLLRTRWAQAARDEEPWLALVDAQARMQPRALLAEIARSIAAPYAQCTEILRRSIVFQARRRRTPFVIAVDEAQLLYKEIDTLETLRRLGDALAGRAGIVVAGNEQVVSLFEPRRRNYFEQWRSRIQQKEVRVLGPLRAEARRMVEGELGQVREEVLEAALDACTSLDPASKKKYVNARALFNSIRDTRRKRRRTN